MKKFLLTCLLVGATTFVFGQTAAKHSFKIQKPAGDSFEFVGTQATAINSDSVTRLIGYPATAKEAEIEGRVIYRILVDGAGTPQDYVLLRSAHPILDRAVREQLPLLRFRPALAGGQAISMWVTIPFDFRLRE